MGKLIVSVVNLKGGAGKSSTIINLGGVLKEGGYKPVLIDSDPQQSATRWAEQGGKNFPFPVVPLEIGKNVKQFKDKLDRIVNEHKADVVLFDTPPQLQDEALLAALLSDVVLIPITPSPLDIWAGEQAVATVKEARKERKGSLPKVILVPSRVVPNTVLAKEINGSLKLFGEPIAPSITMRVAMAESCVAGLPINLYAPNNTSHVEFKNLMKFVFTNLKK
jgi:chromosome partitioning protein